MFGFWRRNDGFKWVTYVPTRIRDRRRQRREKIDAARIEIKSRSRQAAERAARGARMAFAEASAWLVRTAGVAWRKSSALAIACGRHAAARSLGLAQTLRPISIAAWKRAKEPVISSAIGVIGLVLAGAAIVVGLKTGFDTSTVLVAVASMVLAIVLFGSRLFEVYGPRAARALLHVLRRDKHLPASQRWKNLASPAVLTGAGVATAAMAIAWFVLDRLSTVQPVAGQARAVSGEVLKLADKEYRLAGIAAPDPEQRCGEGSRRWSCASDATRSLATLVRGKSIVCHPRAASPPARPTARCYDGDTDIAAELVRLGAVWADENDSRGYRSLESKAKEAKLGIWRAASDPPWAWREKIWAAAKSKAPDGCPIKGTTSGGEKLYHMPWSPDYDRIRVSSNSKSRRWFCTEAEALSAGYRAPHGS